MDLNKVLKPQYVPTSEFYSQVIDSLQDYSIFTLDNDLHINSWNSGAAKIFQYETDEIIGKHFEIIFSEKDKADRIPQLEIETALKDGRALDNRWHVCKDGSEFYAYGLVFPLISIDGKRLGFVKILKDLTEQKKSQEAASKYLQELEELNTHKENVLSILSHDLRSPLAAIIGMIEHIRADYDNIEPEDAKEMLGLIHDAAKDELKMLDQLVEWARIKYASEAFTPIKIDLPDAVEKVFNTLKDVAAIKEINLYNKIDPAVSVFADKKMLQSILQNLVSNAIQYTPQEGKIIVSAETGAENITVQVKDSGEGMSQEIVEKLFTPQLNTLLKARENKKGAGIGLLLVKGFLEKNNGQIRVESQEGAGSSFYFTLPINSTAKKNELSGEVEFTV
ncbi:MAG: PAS domain-containing sensor histidine kinase [Bacteroidota bacterium]